jgi:hypothetical protein
MTQRACATCSQPITVTTRYRNLGFLSYRGGIALRESGGGDTAKV